MTAGTSGRREARLVSRILRAGLLAAVAVQIGWSLRPSPSPALTTQQSAGEALYATNCSSCHGLQAAGTANGPSLRGVGAASVDFMLSTGRMPLANPANEPTRSEPKFTPAQIAAIVAYVQAIAPGGPAIPAVDANAGSLSVGSAAFLNNCAACHGAGATGDSIGGGEIAPALYQATPRQVAEAIRVGPGTMPPFNPRTLTPHDVDSLARYLAYLRQGGDSSRGGFQLGRVGAVAEGLIAAIVGLGILIAVIRLTGERT
jgi:ubiquinol-cytochrome c reductase cytochrome c subunit